MTTSTNSARTRRRTTKTPDDAAAAIAATEKRDAARTKRKTAKPPADAGPTTAPSDIKAGPVKRKPTKPPAGAAPATVATVAPDAPAADLTERSVVEPVPGIAPSSRTTRARLVDRIEQRVAKPPTDPDLGPTAAATAAPGATDAAYARAVDAPAVDAQAVSAPAIVAPAVSAPEIVAPVVDAAPPTRVKPRRVLGRVGAAAGVGVDSAPTEARPVIGAAETRLFDCPKCARPLARGTSRCPGCGIRLIGGVALRRVGAVLAAGIAVCVVVVGGFSAAALAIGGQPSPTAIASKPSIAPSTPAVTPTRPVVVVPVGPPAGALAALSGTAVVNGRITADAATLAATLAKKGATTIEVARALRALAADAALGLDLTGRLAPWSDAAPVTTELDEFYRAVADTARTALRASLADAAGYRRAGAGMLKVLKGLGDVDAASRTLASTVGLELPPLAAPAP